MKKLLIILILALLVYFIYQKYIKEKEQFTSQKKTSQPLLVNLELGKSIKVKSKSFPECEIRLLRIDGANSIVLQIDKGSGTVTKSVDLRKIIGKIGTIEAHLMEVSNTKAKISLQITSGPEEQLEVVKSQ